MINPQHKEPNKYDSVDMTIVYLIQRNRHVVFFLEIKLGSCINHISTRAEADSQMRQRYLNVFESAAPVLHGASALGTRLCFYNLDVKTRRIIPVAKGHDPEFISDVAPKDWWCYDILEAEGEQKMLSIAREVRLIAANIQ